jgi:hypothetical protein
MKNWMTIAAITCLIAMPYGCSQPVGTDCGEEPFLIVNNAAEGSQSQPSISVMNIGNRPVFVTGLGFILNASDDLTVEPPAGCESMYEDQPEEGVLRIICHEGARIRVGPEEELIIDLPVSGPWHRLDLVLLTAVNENGENVWNDLSGDWNQPFWTN